MVPHTNTGARRWLRVLSIASLVAFLIVGAGAMRPAATVQASESVPGNFGMFEALDDRIDLDSLLGYSGKLRARFLAPRLVDGLPVLSELFGSELPMEAGVYPVDTARAAQPFAFITMRAFSEKKNGRIGSYRIGTWPYERRAPRNPNYANPDGFIEVTPENQDTHVSEHFRLRDFLTKDQHAVWPKYLVLDERLLDKLELVIAELQRDGIAVRHMQVMSGFRTPQYNARGVGKGGRATTSRHQYGDAADVFVDNDRNGRMDDLNGDGRVNVKDTRVLLAAVERVERRYPTLAGGAGTYRSNSAHGPFVHIDARGHRARWGE